MWPLSGMPALSLCPPRLFFSVVAISTTLTTRSLLPYSLCLCTLTLSYNVVQWYSELTIASLFYRPAASVVPNAANYATLREIEDRLKSIRNIEKITKTMKIVASTKLTRAQRAMTESRSYGQTSNTVFEEAETKANESEGKKDLLIICSSDKGLCGGIHSGLSRAVRKLMTESDANYDLVILGEKCKAQLSRSNAKAIQLSFSGVGKQVPTFSDAQAIADQVALLPGDYANVKIMYNKFINATSYEATIIEAFSAEAIAASRTPLSILIRLKMQTVC